jgi:acyl-CoA thioesterase-2
LPVSDFEQLLAVLDLKRTDDDTFVGSHPSKNPIRTFGGQMMAQALVAGSRTLKYDVAPSALSAHFIAGGDPEKDLDYRVVRLRDERRFANRRVDVTQDGALLTSVMISYMSAGRGLVHGVTAPTVPDPQGLPKIGELLEGYEEIVPLFAGALRPIEWRYTNDPAWVMRDKGGRLEHNRVWMKSEGPMPADPVLHNAALVYSSDTTILDSIITRHGLSWGWDRIFAVTMDHTVWFHRPVHFDDWVLYSTTSPVLNDSRGLGTGHFFDSAGQMIATVVQEGIVKHLPGAGR